MIWFDVYVKINITQFSLISGKSTKSGLYMHVYVFVWDHEIVN